MRRESPPCFTNWTVITQTDYRRLYYNAAQNSSRTSNRQSGGESGNKRFRYVDGGVDDLCCCGGSYQAAAEEEEVKYKVMIACLVALIVVCCSCSVALAESATPSNFDQTSVMADLNGATIDGKLFDVDDYPLGEDKVPQLLQFAEYGFSTIMDLQHNYGLYFYFYNPSGKEIDPNYCEVLFWLGSKDSDGGFEYENCTLQLLSVSADNVFAKFKLAEHVSDTYNRVAMTPASREYHIAGIQLRYKGELNSVDYKVGGKWIYSGYAQGMSANSQQHSTLACVCDKLTVLDVETHFAYYRMYNSTVTQIQLSSVYFSVDKSFDDQYDDLYSVQAQMYKYLSSPMFALFDDFYFAENDVLIKYDEVYADLLLQKGQKMVEGNEDRWLAWGIDDPAFDWTFFRLGAYNHAMDDSKFSLDTLSWLFRVGSDEGFVVTPDVLLSYMKDYTNEYAEQGESLVLGKYSQDLFSNNYYISSENLPGGIEISPDDFLFDGGYHLIDLNNEEDKFTFVGSPSSADLWQILLGNHHWFDINSCIPIERVYYDDISNMSDEDISSKYFIAPELVNDFKNHVRSNSDKVTYIFRFSADTYFSPNLHVSYKVGNNSLLSSGKVGYMVQQPIFLDFDIISLGYLKGDTVVKIPVVNNPQDFIGSMQPGQPVNDYFGEVSEMFTQLLTILFGLVLIAVLAFFVVWALKVIFKGR